MAMTATLAQPLQALVNQACQFILTVSNSGASTVNVNTIQPIVLNANGLPAPPGNYNLGIIEITPQVGTPNAQGVTNQLNVPVAASGSASFGFNVIWFGPVIAGGLSNPTMQFQVTANVSSSDSSVFSPPTLVVPVGQPQFGQAEWVQPFQAPPIGSLQFNVPLNSNLIL